MTAPVLTKEQRVERAREMVSALCKPRGSAGSREWLMTIPARPDYDPDLIIADALDACDEMAAERDAALAEVAKMKAIVCAAETRRGLYAGLGPEHIISPTDRAIAAAVDEYRSEAQP